LLLLAAGFSGVPSRFWGTSARTQAELSGIQAAASESQSSADVVQVTRSDRPTVESRYASSSLPLRREGVYLGVSIRELPVATWILADNPETRGNLGLDYSRVDPRDLRVLRLRMVKPDGGQLLIDRLEFVENLDESQVQVGSTFYLSYPELDVTGDAELLAIHSCPPIPARPSPRHCLVTSKFTHEAAEVLDLSIEGVAGPIGVTPNHPIWSDDRREFVRADALAVGESLLDAQGARVAVREIVARSGRVEVFNLEVDGEHVYHVSSTGVLVHNNYADGVASGSFPIPNSGKLARLTPDHLGLPKGSTLTGSVSRRGNEVLVRIEKVEIPEEVRDGRSLVAVIAQIREAAKSAGATKLTFEGVSVGNRRLADILVRRYGANYTPQRTLVFEVPLN
jgi:hypothetical protein